MNYSKNTLFKNIAAQVTSEENIFKAPRNTKS